MDLSILIPARNEMWLSKTVEDIVANMEGDTEVIVVADGNWPDPPIMDHPRVHLIYHPVSVGQRAATNEAARISQAKYLIKTDAHCAFDKGFDVKMMAEMQEDWTMVPIMRNLHCFDWVCDDCGDRRYQGPTPLACPKCDNTSKFTRDVRWVAKTNPQSTSYCFDAEPHFQYFQEFKKRPEYKGKDLTETMSLQGSFFMCTRKKYHELNLCDESFGSWGSQGIEVAVKTWLSGGRVVCNHKTWYGHMFRTQGGDFGFPYELSGRQVSRAKRHARDIFFGNKWGEQQKLPLSWLLDKFWPVYGWTEEQREALRKGEPTFAAIEPSTATQCSDSPIPALFAEPQPKVTEPEPTHEKPTVGMVYYTDSRLDEKIAVAVQKQLLKVCNGHALVSVSLKPIEGFGKNICLDIERGYLAMAKQQLAGLEALDADVAFMVEHDIIYPACHFDFVPPRKDTFYYNLNWWKVRVDDGQALHFKARQVSGLCAYKDILIEYYRNRVRMIENGEIGGRRHFEPGGGGYRTAGYDQLTTHGIDNWFSETPYVDIRHKTVVTRNIFDPSGYRNQVVDWTMADEIPYWGKTKGRFWEFLDEAMRKEVG